MELNGPELGPKLRPAHDRLIPFSVEITERHHRRASPPANNSGFSGTTGDPAQPRSPHTAKPRNADQPRNSSPTKSINGKPPPPTPRHQALPGSTEAPRTLTATCQETRGN